MFFFHFLLGRAFSIILYFSFYSNLLNTTPIFKWLSCLVLSFVSFLFELKSTSPFRKGLGFFPFFLYIAPLYPLSFFSNTNMSLKHAWNYYFNATSVCLRFPLVILSLVRAATGENLPSRNFLLAPWFSRISHLW